MKHIIKLNFISLLVLLLGCNNDTDPPKYSNGWISLDDYGFKSLVNPDINEDVEVKISFSKGGLDDALSLVSLNVDDSYVARINESENKNYKLLPESCYSLNDLDISLPIGQQAGSGFFRYNPFKIAELTSVNKEEYILPISLSSAEGLKVNPDKSVIIYSFRIDHLIFEENFNQADKIPDHSNWELCPRQAADWSRYLSNSYDHAYVENGNLVLKAEVRSGSYLTGGIQSKGRFFFQYGRIEVKARFTKMAQGAWPAIWMMPETPKYTGGWPKGGEIDIMEQLNHETVIHQSIHSHYYDNLGIIEPKPNATTGYNFGEYNIYGIEWDNEQIEFLVNGEVTHRYRNLHLDDETDKMQWPFDAPFFIILNVSVGGPGTWPGPITNGELPAIMEIDWVRVSQKR
ncbi:MAG: family 16 glycosylhydrolase [Bacteroidales bacterium]|nr:family 16 glycosylhydrolase [Bacteroidales bacterium]